YGTIPIVRATGGLDDSVTDFTESAAKANGVKFYEYSPHALAKAIRKSLAIYENKELLAKFRRNGMKTDHSWGKAVMEFIQAYELCLGKY
ncbi:MAG TPA: hypothetical protein VF607_11435, partial [Verrucomicrobiae bacterium]